MNQQELIIDLENIDVQIDDEVHALLLLCSLLKTHDHFKENLTSRDSLS